MPNSSTKPRQPHFEFHSAIGKRGDILVERGEAHQFAIARHPSSLRVHLHGLGPVIDGEMKPRRLCPSHPEHAYDPYGACGVGEPALPCVRQSRGGTDNARRVYTRLGRHVFRTYFDVRSRSGSRRGRGNACTDYMPSLGTRKMPGGALSTWRPSHPDPVYVSVRHVCRTMVGAASSL